MDKLNIDAPGFSEPTAGIVTGGQPDLALLTRLRNAGLRYVINLRPAAEDSSFDEAGAAKALGLNYLNLPISGPADFSPDNVASFNQLLNDVSGEATLIHCASGNRVGALYALRAAWLHSKTTDEALAIGRAHGLTKLEGTVRTKLEQSQV